MILISLNIRGLGASHKTHFLKDIILSHCPTLVLIQETMVSKETLWESLLKMCSDWFVCATSASGLSSGLAILWNPREIKLEAYLSCVGMILSSYVKGNHSRIGIVNSYAP